MGNNTTTRGPRHPLHSALVLITPGGSPEVSFVFVVHIPAASERPTLLQPDLQVTDTSDRQDPVYRHLFLPACSKMWCCGLYYAPSEQCVIPAVRTVRVSMKWPICQVPICHLLHVTLHVEYAVDIVVWVSPYFCCTRCVMSATKKGAIKHRGIAAGLRVLRVVHMDLNRFVNQHFL